MKVSLTWPLESQSAPLSPPRVVARTAAYERGGGGQRKKRGRERKKRNRACFRRRSFTVGIHRPKGFSRDLLEEREGASERQRADVIAGLSLCFQPEIDPTIQYNVAACVGTIAGNTVVFVHIYK